MITVQAKTKIIGRPQRIPQSLTFKYLKSFDVKQHIVLATRFTPGEVKVSNSR